jgi:hypothetical protein
VTRAAVRPRNTDIFINCPFDFADKPTFNAIVFTAYVLKFVARCALEFDDSGEVRLERIQRLVE